MVLHFTTHNTQSGTLVSQCEQHTREIGAALGKHLRSQWQALVSQHGIVVTLHGDLGTGKTVFCRGLIHAFNPLHIVKSPTFEIMRSYECDHNRLINHVDFYRITDPQELQYFAFHDSLNPDTMSLIEWPQKAEGALPDSRYKVTIQALAEQQRSITITQ